MKKKKKTLAISRKGTLGAQILIALSIARRVALSTFKQSSSLSCLFALFSFTGR